VGLGLKAKRKFEERNGRIAVEPGKRFRPTAEPKASRQKQGRGGEIDSLKRQGRSQDSRKNVTNLCKHSVVMKCLG